MMLPKQFRTAGLVLIVLGMILFIRYMFFEFIIITTVPALLSVSFQTRWLAFQTTNIADELIMLSFILGFLMVVYSRENDEKPEFMELRKNAMFKAVKTNALVLVFSVVFIYGRAFLSILFLNTVLIFLVYLWYFRRSLARFRRSKN